MLAVGVSYRQTIRAYPHGGGSYIVASENLSRTAGLLAAAGLMIDYVLTVAVSIAAGLAALTSAIPSLGADIVPIGVAVIALLLAGNLRGVRQAGALFAAPTYLFIVAVFLLVAVGLGQAAGRGFHSMPPPTLKGTEGIGVLLVLRAFASGSTAMTGIEATSNAVPVFRPTSWRNARAVVSECVWAYPALSTTRGVRSASCVRRAGSYRSPHEWCRARSRGLRSKRRRSRLRSEQLADALSAAQ